MLERTGKHNKSRQSNSGNRTRQGPDRKEWILLFMVLSRSDLARTIFQFGSTQSLPAPTKQIKPKGIYTNT